MEPHELNISIAINFITKFYFIITVKPQDSFWRTVLKNLLSPHPFLSYFNYFSIPAVIERMEQYLQ